MLMSLFILSIRNAGQVTSTYAEVQDRATMNTTLRWHVNKELRVGLFTKIRLMFSAIFTCISPYISMLFNPIGGAIPLGLKTFHLAS